MTAFTGIPGCEAGMMREKRLTVQLIVYRRSYRVRRLLGHGKGEYLVLRRPKGSRR